MFSQQSSTSPVVVVQEVDKMSSGEEHNPQQQQEEYANIPLLPSFSQGYSFDDGEGHHPHARGMMFHDPEAMHPSVFLNDSPTSSTNEGEEPQVNKEEEATPRTQPASHIRPRQANQEGHQLLIPNLSSIGSFPPLAASSVAVHPRPSPPPANPSLTLNHQQYPPSLQLLQPQHNIAYTHPYPSSSRMKIPIRPHTPYPQHPTNVVAALSSTVTPMQSAQQQQRPTILIAPSQNHTPRRRAQGPVWTGRAWTKANVSSLMIHSFDSHSHCFVL